MNKKKILAFAMVLSMIAILAIGGTIAYFTAEDSAENVFTVGNVEIELTEPNWDNQGSVDGENAYPGEPLAKDPTVTNIGNNPCFVRIKVSGLNVLQIHSLSEELIRIRNSNYELDEVNEGWFYTQHESEQDGEYTYIYYNKVLGTEEDNKTTATPAFSHIVIPFDTNNEGTGEEFTIDVIAQAVQAQGAKPSWSAVQAMTEEEIVEWFNLCWDEETKVEEL